MTKIAVDPALIEQAIEVLTDKCGGRCNAEYNPCHALEVATTLRAALAKPAVKPAEFVYVDHLGGTEVVIRDPQLPKAPTPPAEVPLLTEAEFEAINCSFQLNQTGVRKFGRAIEQAVLQKAGLK